MNDKINTVARMFNQKLIEAAFNDHSLPIKNDAVEIVKLLTKADPTPTNKHITYIVRMYIKGLFKYEDVNQIKKDISKFIEVQHLLQNNDLNNYESLTQLYSAVDVYASQEILSTKEEIRQAKLGIEYIVNDGNFKSFVTKTHQANMIYGKGTRWCTTEADGNTFEHYSKQGDLVVIICTLNDGTTRKYQLHMESGQFCNELDEQIKTRHEVDPNDMTADVNILRSFPGFQVTCQHLADKFYPPLIENAKRQRQKEIDEGIKYD